MSAAAIIRDGLNVINNYWMSIPIPEALRVLITFLVFRNVLFAIRRYFFGDERELAEKDKGFIVDCDSLEMVEKEIEKAKRRDKAVVIDYGAVWCPPCRRIKPIFAKMSKEFRDSCAFLAVDVDEARDASMAAKIQCMPTFHFYTKDGEKLDDEVQGLDVGKLRRILTKDLGCEASAFEEDEKIEEDRKKLARPGPGTIKDRTEKKKD